MSRLAQMTERQNVLVEDNKEIKAMLASLLENNVDIQELKTETEKIKELDLKVNVIYKVAAFVITILTVVGVYIDKVFPNGK